MKNILKNQTIELPSLHNEVMSWEYQVKKFVESRRLNEARKILEITHPTEENDAALKYWQRVLGEAKVISKTPASGVSSHKNIEWLRQHALKHQGQWVALQAGILLGANESRVTLRQQIKELKQHRGAVFIKIGEKINGLSL